MYIYWETSMQQLLRNGEVCEVVLGTIKEYSSAKFIKFMKKKSSSCDHYRGRAIQQQEKIKQNM
jgi:hypothetical protein